MGRGGAGAAGASNGAVTASTRLLVVAQSARGPRRGGGGVDGRRAHLARCRLHAAAGGNDAARPRARAARRVAAGGLRRRCGGGGDGSLHEAVNGLMAAGTPRPPLGLIPAATGNSLAADLECLDPHQAARAIIDGRTRPLDVMEVRLGPAGDRGAGAAAALAAVGAALALPR